MLKTTDDLHPQRVRCDRGLQPGCEQWKVVVNWRSIGTCDGMRFDRFHHALADAPSWYVNHPSQAHIIVWVDDQSHVGESVLDLLAFVEPHAPDDLVGEPFSHERV